MPTALPAAPSESARCPIVACRDGASPVRPLHNWLESGPPVQPQGELVFRLHGELDASGTASTQLLYSPAEKLATQASAPPRLQHTDEPDLTCECRAAIE